jgi:hypothetical protein
VSEQVSDGLVKYEIKRMWDYEGIKFPIPPLSSLIRYLHYLYREAAGILACIGGHATEIFGGSLCFPATPCEFAYLGYGKASVRAFEYVVP